MDCEYSQKPQIVYSMADFASVVEDVQIRAEYFKEFAALLQRRVLLEGEYAEKLKLISLDELKIVNAHRPSQCLYKTFLGLLRDQGKDISNSSKKLQGELLVRIKRESDDLLNESRKMLLLGQSFEKDMIVQRERLEKSRVKFDRKNKDLERLKLDYIITVAGTENLEKKNRLELKVNSCEEELQPLKKQYMTLASKYNELVDSNSLRMSRILSSLENIELKKLSLMKNTAIDYQLEKTTQAAAILSNQQLLSRLDNIVLENTEITPFDQENMQRDKFCMLSPFVNQSEYIDETFSRLHKNSIESLIAYGQSSQYKLQLSAVYEGVPKPQKSCLNAKSIRVIQIFKATFEEVVSEDSFLFKEFEMLVRGNSFLRKDFIMCLQKYRISRQFELKMSNYNPVLRVLRIFLDECEKQLDSYNTKLLMVLSLTYYFRDDTRKIDLQELISEHSIWSKVGWWDSALLESIYEETKVKIKKAEVTLSIWDIKGAGIKKIETGEEMTFQNISFSQLTYYLHNMLLFKLNPGIVEEFAKKYIRLLGCNDKMADTLLGMCCKERQTEETNGRTDVS